MLMRDPDPQDHLSWGSGLNPPAMVPGKAKGAFIFS
jgi:hypothetical protein